MISQICIIVGTLLICVSVVYGALYVGALEGWVTPFDDEDQQKTILKGIRDAFLIGIGLVVIGVML